MNKTAIKNFAIWARVQLMEAARQRAFEYGITERSENKPHADVIAGRVLSAEEKIQRQQLIVQIQQKGFAQVMEEAAYTWFNRLIALRFMEVNGYLPSKIRVFTDETGAFKPEILKQALSVDLEGLDRKQVVALLEAQANEELYKYLLITQCNALSASLPLMFEKIENWTELLFPSGLLRPGSVLERLVTDIPEEDWLDQVQIIGWLYQYYNNDIRDEIDRVQGIVKIRKEQIPAATQVFTPDWIVRYMVENSLGRLWYEGHRDFDKSQWRYYLERVDQESENEQQLKKARTEYASIKPEEIKVIDPCMGSGHILVYAFDVLMQIYTSVGWSERDAAKSIVENNLYGLDIDDRAGQLAYFAVMMKARKYNRRILNIDIEPNVFPLIDSTFMTDDFIAYVSDTSMSIREDLEILRKTFQDAKEFGSLLVPAQIDYSSITNRINIISRSTAEDLFQAHYQVMATIQLLPLVKQSYVMTQKYDAVITNPPFMGARLLNDSLRGFLHANYDKGKTDTYAAFIIRCYEMKTTIGFVGMMTPNTWLTINSYKKIREYLIKQRALTNMLLLSSEAFDGAGVVVTSFVLGPQRQSAIFFDLSGFDENQIVLQYEKLKDKKTQNREICKFAQLPNSIIDASFSDKMIEMISTTENVYSIINSDGQTKTGNNDKYLRAIWEVSTEDIGISKKWCIHAKGGGYRKWYGNLEYVIDWSNKARDFYRSDRVARITPEYLWYKEGITWSLISGQNNSFRLLPEGITFNCAAPTVFTETRNTEYYLLALLNTKLAQTLLRKFNTTVNLTIDDVGSIPYINDINKSEMIEKIANNCVDNSKIDWDAFETSWDFERHPLLRLKLNSLKKHIIYMSDGTICEEISSSGTLEHAYTAWYIECEKRFKQLKYNEEELNRIFIDIYGLQDELTPEVEDKDVTVYRIIDEPNEEERKMRYVLSKKDAIITLISYAVGCMLGRYSPYVDGLLYAGGEWDEEAIHQRILEGARDCDWYDPKEGLFLPDRDGILPISDDEYFQDDAVNRLVAFVRKVYGKETLEENLRFIAGALGGSGTPREVIRNYFLKDFYADHLKTYQKRPIYWLFDSGKQNGFKALIYMHRYQPDLLARMRTDYVHEQQERYRTQLKMLELSAQTAAPSERVKLNKQIGKLKDQALETQKYEEQIHHLADQMIAIDLDDGVKVNYAKFKDVLAKI